MYLIRIKYSFEFTIPSFYRIYFFNQNNLLGVYQLLFVKTKERTEVMKFHFLV